MIFTREKKQAAWNILSKRVREFILDSETSELIENILRELNLPEEQHNLADSEILYSMYGLQTLSDAIFNIAQISNKKVIELSDLKNTLQEKIFYKIKELEDQEMITEGEVVQIESNLERRISELAQKYSLDANKNNLLINIISKTTKSTPLDDLSEKISTDLGFSSVISEQIAMDIQSRVFEYSPKTKPSQSQKESVLEIRPNNPPLTEEYKLSSEIRTNVPTYAPKPKVVIGQDPVQTPVPVPRFKAVPLSDNEIGADFIPNLTPKPSAIGLMESKLNKVMPGVVEIKKEDKPIVKNYSVDPYREPLN